jgi:hypothetical protein
VGGKRWIAALVAALVVGAASVPAHASDWPRNGSRRVVVVVDGVGPAWDAPLGASVAQWNRSPKLDVRVVAGATDAPTGTCPAQPGQIRICSANYTPHLAGGSSMALGCAASANPCASIRIDTGIITQPIAAKWGITKTWLDGWGGRRALLLHQVGAALGIDTRTRTVLSNNDLANIAARFP